MRSMQLFHLFLWHSSAVIGFRPRAGWLSRIPVPVLVHRAGLQACHWCSQSRRTALHHGTEAANCSKEQVLQQPQHATALQVKHKVLSLLHTWHGLPLSDKKHLKALGDYKIRCRHRRKEFDRQS